MNNDAAGVWAVVEGAALNKELRLRRTAFLHQTVPGGKRESMEKEGWILDRRNKKSIRMKKRKPTGDALEDDIWALLAQMGFGEMNHGRQFKIPLGTAPPKQIDVFARDELSALIVSCKENSSWGRLSLQSELESLNGLRQQLTTEIRKRYEAAPPHFVGIVLATRNVEWSQPDLDRASQYGIRPFRDEELVYFNKLTSLIATAARYQFMGELFAGLPIPRMSAHKVAAVRGRYKNVYFYQFMTDAETMARLGFVQHRARVDRTGRLPYQRLVQKSRLPSIASYIQEGSVFPTNIVVNFQENQRKLRFEQAAKNEQPAGELTFGNLILPSTFKSAWIIDGQHRLYAYFHKSLDPTFRKRPQLPVLAFDQLPAEEEANLFIQINTNQKRVSRNLLHELGAELNLGSSHPKSHFLALMSVIALNLNTDRRSPLFNRIKSEQATSRLGTLTLDAVIKSLVGSKLIGTLHPAIKPFAPGPLARTSTEATIQRTTEVLSAYLKIFSEGAEAHWDAGNRRNTTDKPGGYLCTNIGVAALISLLDALVEHLEEVYKEPFDQKTPEEFIETVRPYTRPIINYFMNPTAAQITDFRRHLGAGAPRHGMRKMQLIIATADENFHPEGLAKYVEEEEQAEVDGLNALYRPLEADLLKVIIAKLQDVYGANWFLAGVPLHVKTKALELQDREKARELEECFFMPTDGKLIIQANIQHFKPLFQQPDEKWLDKLIFLRNGISHAPYHIEPWYEEFLANDIRNIVDKATAKTAPLGP